MGEELDRKRRHLLDEGETSAGAFCGPRMLGEQNAMQPPVRADNHGQLARSTTKAQVIDPGLFATSGNVGRPAYNYPLGSSEWGRDEWNPDIPG